jgi:hypothetical protein
MLVKAATKILLATALATAMLSPTLAAKKHARTSRVSGACAQPTGRCISDCDQYNWCQMNVCSNGNSTPVAFWRCFEPSGLCLAPHC